MLRQLERIEELLNEAKAKYPEAKMIRNGDVEYANGNDGTDFDWEANGRLCEFGCGYEDDLVWAFKCFVYNDGNVSIYCYPNGESSPVEKLEYEDVFTKEELKELYNHMLKNYDRKLNWDCYIRDIEQ